MRLVPERGAEPIVLSVIDLARQRQHEALLVVVQLPLRLLAHLVPAGHDLALFQTAAVSGLVLRLIDEIAGPGGNGFADDLSPFPIREGEHIEISIALRGLRPELAGDLA